MGISSWWIEFLCHPIEQYDGQNWVPSPILRGKKHNLKPQPS